ncbi:MAG TPA: YkgJ family cysteine cluster protein [Ferruginibacter sp.]|nr:YkgJ family cysteine cluster protein [Ferruginibacter sp.]HRO18217.1 YkgJ family cysteine cluster protein [Ferruginibacter sp.]HRQ20480.1 YkgJ family cysteine cluster protein [Ferruginibacter sp.]
MKDKKQDNSKVYGQMLKKIQVQKALKWLPEMHEAAFEKIDCLDCAACCKQYSPRFKTPDIKRIARFLQMKEGVFIETFLKLDEEGDYVTQKSPCPFLLENNACSIYDVRPSDCSRFPYTNEDVLLKRQHITLKNATFCPAVVYVLDAILQKTGYGK